MPVLQLDTPDAMRRWSDAARASGGRVALVPTMGALHEGHLRLLEVAHRHGEHVVGSLFVNPLQFDRAEDLAAYPRTFDADLIMFAAAGVTAVYCPTPATMYPAGFQTHVVPGSLAEPMEGAARPGHFRGVATVVAKLFNVVRPDVAVFGQKDYQQLTIIRRMVIDLDLGIEIVAVPTVREPDGLALSSRNRRLSPEDRAAARCVPAALEAAAAALASGERRGAALEHVAAAAVATEPRARLEYVQLADAETLERLDVLDRPAVMAIAVWFGDVRLIDNRLVRP
jgi:pantoate--beta-alanine ligase